VRAVDDQVEKEAVVDRRLRLAGIIYMNIDLSQTRWGARMSTVGTYNKDWSALGRIKVWEWTVRFVATHPLGGGFDSFLHQPDRGRFG
jgi:putative inorganic carbon (HCO3(-)) transporter